MWPQDNLTIGIIIHGCPGFKELLYLLLVTTFIVVQYFVQKSWNNMCIFPRIYHHIFEFQTSQSKSFNNFYHSRLFGWKRLSQNLKYFESNIWNFLIWFQHCRSRFIGCPWDFNGLCLLILSAFTLKKNVYFENRIHSR